jgi:hypothetical protein
MLAFGSSKPVPPFRPSHQLGASVEVQAAVVFDALAGPNPVNPLMPPPWLSAPPGPSEIRRLCELRYFLDKVLNLRCESAEIRHTGVGAFASGGGECQILD